MRGLLNVVVLVLLSVSTLLCQAQITAITSDGRKVMLYDDGTWKYVFETDGKKIVLNQDGTWKYADASVPETKPAVVAGAVVGAAATIPVNPTTTTTATTTTTTPTTGSIVTIVPDSTTTPVDSVKKVAVVPPKPKPPPNLNCNALVDIQKDLSGDRYVALSKDFFLSDDKTGFKFSIRKTKKSPITWTTTILQPGACLVEEAKMLIVFQTGGRLQVPMDGKANCAGDFQILFGGDYGKEEILETLKQTGITGIRVTTTKGFVDQQLSEESMLRFKAALGCIPK